MEWNTLPQLSSTMLINGQLAEGDPRKSIHRLLKDLMKTTNSISGCIYNLSFSKSQFNVESVKNRGGEAPTLDFKKLNRLRDAEAKNQHSCPPTDLLARVILSKQPLVIDDLSEHTSPWWHHPAAASLVAFPIISENNCVGMVELDSTEVKNFGTSELQLVEASTAIARLLFEKAESLQLLESLQQPIDFRLPFSEFISKQLEVSVLATDMPYLALREWDGDETLECLGAYGFDGLDLRELDLVGLEDYPFFLNAIQQEETIAVGDSWDVEDDAIQQRSELRDVRSYMVAPIRVGEDRVFGTLSCAAECTHNYSELETRGLETIANAIGVAILNYRNANSRTDEIAEHTKVGAALTSVEVAQAARHEARNALAQASVTLTTIYNACNTNGRIDREKIFERIEQMVEHHQAADRSLDKIRQITKPPTRDLEKASITALWKQAFGLVNGRLDDLKIRYNVQGPDTSINVYPEYLRHAFLNLILNSVDAYRESRRRQKREIKVYLDPLSANSNKVRMRYVDNATGIDLARLGPKKSGEILGSRDIFKAGVTAKKEGSGFGLFLVRQITIDHDGSIELKDFKNGVTFELSISKELKGK